MKMTGRIFNLKKGAELLMESVWIAIGKTAISQGYKELTKALFTLIKDNFNLNRGQIQSRINMRGILMLFTMILAVSSTQAATCTQTFSVSGNDDDPTVLTINAASLSCMPVGSTITSITLTNSAGSLLNGNCVSGGGSYDFTLSVDGGAGLPACGGAANGADITGFTSLTITSADNDGSSDAVAIMIDVEVEYSCHQTFTVSGNDDDPTVLTITSGMVNCFGGPGDQLILTNSAGSLVSGNCANGGGGWYNFTLSVDGGPGIPACGGGADGIDITGFSILTITSSNTDGWSDAVTITIDVAVVSYDCSNLFTYNSFPQGCGELISFAANPVPVADSIVFDFGNGQTFTTNGISAQVFYNGGLYEAEVTAYHNNGCVSTSTQWMNISGLQVSMAEDTVVCQSDFTFPPFISGGSGNYIFEWLPTTGLDDPNSQYPTLSQNVHEEYYYLTVTDPVNGCQVHDSILVTRNAPLIETHSLCDGPVTIDLGPGATSYEWLSFTDTAGNNSNLNYPSTVQSILVDEPGEYFMYAVFPGCGALTGLVTVEACESTCDNTFTYNIITGPCIVEEFAFFGAASTQVVEWLWDFGDGATSTAEFPTHVFDQGVYEVSLTTVDIDGCEASSTQMFTANGGFGVVAIQDSVFCQSSGHLGATVYGGSTQYTYQWSPATGLSDPTVLIPQVSGVHEQMYTLTVTDQQSGCTAVDSTLISAYTFIEETVQLCGDSVYLDMGPGADMYNWLPLYDDDYETQAIWADDTGTFYVYAAYPDCGAVTHIFNIEECSGGCSSSFVHSLDAPVCASWADFVATTSSPTDSIEFFFGDGSSFTANGISAQHFFLTGVYNVEMVAYHTDGCVSVYSELLTVGGGLSVDIWPNGPIACGGDIQLSTSITNGSGNYGYQWFANGNLSNPTIATPVLSAITVETEVTVYVTDIATGCQVADTVLLLPNFPLVETYQLCSDSVYFDAPEGSEFYSWWHEDLQGNTTTFTTNDSFFYGTEPGIYYCMSYTSGCQQITHEFHVVECPGSCAIFFTHNETGQGCGSVVEFILNYTPPLDSVLVDFGDGTVETYQATNISHYYAWGGNYTVTMIGHHIDGCTSDQAAVINVQGGFSAEIIPDGITCGGDIPLSAQITGGSGNYSYWWFNSSSSLSDPQIANPILSEISAETEIILNIVDIGNGCQYNDTVTLYPNLPVIETLELCNGFVVMEVPGGSEMYSWTFEHPSGTITTLPATGPVYTGTEVGVYTCVSYTSGCAVVTHEFTVEPCSGPCSSFFSYNMIPNGCGAIVDFLPGYTPNVDSILYFLGDGTTEVSFGNTLQHNYPTGSFTVQMVAYHIDGCISQSAQVIHITTGLDVEIFNDSMACGGDVILGASVTGGTNGYMYEWFVDGLPFSGSTQSNPIIDALTGPTEISVFVSDSANNCTASDTTIMYPNLPVNDTLELCGNQVWLEVPSNSEMYSWSFEDLQGNWQTLPSTFHIVGATELGTYTCITYTQGCQTVVHEFTVTDCTVGCFAQIDSDLTYDGCGAWLDFSLSGTSAIDSVIWDLGNGQIEVDEGQGPTVYYGSGNYIVFAEVIFNNGCVYSTSYGVTLLTEVIAEIWEDTIACSGTLPLGVDVTGGGGQYDFEWSPAFMMDDPADQYPLMTVLESTVVTVTITDTFTGCTVQDSVMVYANEPINEVLELCQDSISLIVDPGSMIYQWTYTDQAGNTTQLPDLDNQITATGLGTYACFTYYSGCATITHLFTVVECAGSNDDVWPGDANSDNIVSNADALWLGLGFSQTGPIRPNASLNWVGQPADDWVFNFSYNNVNLKHADCDGNGIINFDDTLAIDQNYGLTHNKTDVEVGGGEPELWVEAVPDTAGLEQAVHVSVYMAKSDLIVDSIHGLAFSLVWDESLTMPSEVQINYDQSIFGTPGADLLTFNKKIPNEGRMDLAMTRVDGVNLDGHGLLCQLRIVTIDNLSGIAYLPIAIEGVTAITSSEDTVNFILTSDVVVIDPENTSILEASSQRPIQAFPNPTTGIVTIVNDGDMATLEVMDSRGRIVMSTNLPEQNRTEIDLSNYEAGIYHLRMSTSSAIRYSKLQLTK